MVMRVSASAIVVVVSQADVLPSGSSSTPNALGIACLDVLDPAAADGLRDNTWPL